MKEKNGKNTYDNQEFEYPDTTYVRDIENRVFQGIALQTLSLIKDITLTDGGFFDHLFGRSQTDTAPGITVQQDNKNHSVSLKVEINVRFGVSIPDKAEEIQSKIAAEVTKMTGLHVSEVHVVFKNIIGSEHKTALIEDKKEKSSTE